MLHGMRAIRGERYSWWPFELHALLLIFRDTVSLFPLVATT